MPRQLPKKHVYGYLWECFYPSHLGAFLLPVSPCFASEAGHSSPDRVIVSGWLGTGQTHPAAHVSGRPQRSKFRS